MPFTLFPLENFPNEIIATIFSILFITILIIELRILIKYKSKKEDKASFFLIIAGIFMPFSIKTLGKYFVPMIEKQKSRKIIQTGPYKYIRNPSYTGLLLELIGFSLALSNTLSLLITLLVFIPAIAYRIKIEEYFLLKNFKSYEDYKKELKINIIRILRARRLKADCIHGMDKIRVRFPASPFRSPQRKFSKGL